MKLYNDVLRRLYALLPEEADRLTAYRSELCAAPGDKNAILLRGDAAFELGGSAKPAVSFVLFGETGEDRDAVVLYGDDLQALKQDTAFAHVTVVQLKPESEAALRYEQLREIGFRLFQLYPKGYHIRMSPSANREQVRVAKSALQSAQPLSFLNVGCSLIRLLKEHEDVLHVKTIYITGNSVNYPALSALARRAGQITDAVQHTFTEESLDCATCKMKPICDEVDGLRELHFKQEQERKSHDT